MNDFKEKMTALKHYYDAILPPITPEEKLFLKQQRQRDYGRLYASNKREEQGTKYKRGPYVSKYDKKSEVQRMADVCADLLSDLTK